MPRRLTSDDRRFVPLLGALTAVTALGIDTSLPTLPATAVALHAPESVVGASITAYLLGLVVGQLAWGPLADRLGRRPPVIAGLALYALGGVACALTNDAFLLLAARALQGIGACAGYVVTRAVVRDIYPPSRGSAVLSTLQAIVSVAPLLAPVAGALLFDLASWRAVYWFLTACGIALGLLVVVWLPETLDPANRQRLDPRAIARNYGIFSRRRDSMGYAFVTALSFGGMMGYISGSSFVVVDVFHVRPDMFPLFFGLTAIALLVGNAINARLAESRSVDERLRFGVIGLVVSASVMAFVALLGFGGPLGFVVPMMGYTFFLGFTAANSVVEAMHPVPQIAGTASALIGSLQMFGGVVASFVVGLLYDRSSHAVAEVAFGCALACLAAYAVATTARTRTV